MWRTSFSVEGGFMCIQHFGDGLGENGGAHLCLEECRIRGYPSTPEGERKGAHVA